MRHDPVTGISISDSDEAVRATSEIADALGEWVEDTTDFNRFTVRLPDGSVHHVTVSPDAEWPRGITTA